MRSECTLISVLVQNVSYFLTFHNMPFSRTSSRVSKQRADAEKHRQQLARLVQDKQRQADSGIEDDRDLDTDDALELLGKQLIINYGEGGYKMGKSRVRNFLRPPPPRVRVKLVAPLF